MIFLMDKDPSNRRVDNGPTSIVPVLKINIV
jgi:hypothetical protein